MKKPKRKRLRTPTRVDIERFTGTNRKGAIMAKGTSKGKPAGKGKPGGKC